MANPVICSNVHKTTSPHSAPAKSENNDVAADVRKAAGLAFVAFITFALIAIAGGILNLTSGGGDHEAAFVLFPSGFLLLVIGYAISAALNALAAIIDNTKSSADNTRLLLAKLGQHSSVGL